MGAFFIILIFGEPAIQIGPVNYGMEQCEERKDEAMDLFRDAQARGKVLKRNDGRLIALEDIQVVCSMEPAIRDGNGLVKYR